jgi:YD repeat-containing protein
VRQYGTGQTQPEGADFQYYGDGRLKFASDFRTDATANGLHDRAYSYDHIGRLKESYSGKEATDFLNGTNSGILNGGFRQSYSYDVWNNLTTRTGRFWSEDDSSTDSYNSQNRNPLWEYDAAGRLVSTNDPPPNDLPYQPLRFTYDASGNRAQSTQTTSRHSPIQNSNIIFTTATTNSSTYDGDGMLVQSARTTQFNNNAPTTNTTFYVRSSLFRSVVAQYDSAGVRQKAYVFAGRSLLAQQQRNGDGTTRLMWQHINPLTGDGLDTDSNGVALDRTTVDPMGVNLGDSDPFTPPADGSEDGTEGASQSAINAMVAAIIPGWGGPTCKIDGMVTSCRLALGALSSGAAVLLSPGANTTPRMVVYQGQSVLATYQATYDGYQGYMPITAQYTGNGTFSAIGSGGPPNLQTNTLHDTNFALLNHASGEAHLALSAQNSGANPFPTFSKDNLKTVNDAIKLAQEMTKKKGCDEALKAYGIASLAALISGMTPNGNMFDGRTSTLTGPIGKNGATESMAAYFKENKTSVGAAVFPNSVTGRGSITFLGDYFFNPASVDWVAFQRAIIMMHESVHEVGGKGDAAFGSSKQLSEKIIEKCWPALKGKLGGVG